MAEVYKTSRACAQMKHQTTAAFLYFKDSMNIVIFTRVYILFCKVNCTKLYQCIWYIQVAIYVPLLHVFMCRCFNYFEKVFSGAITFCRIRFYLDWGFYFFVKLKAFLKIQSCSQIQIFINFVPSSLTGSQLYIVSEVVIFQYFL